MLLIDDGSSDYCSIVDSIIDNITKVKKINSIKECSMI